MALDRRSLLKMAGGVWLIPAGASRRWSGQSTAWEARELVRRGDLGRVVFCRASKGSARWLRFVLDGAMPVCERIDADELVLCGTEATLVVDGRGIRRFA